MQYRITLTPRRFKFSHTSSCGREDIMQNERILGNTYFSDFNLEWAGHILLTDTCQLSAQWLYETNDVVELENYILTHDLVGHKIAVYEIDDEEPEEALIIEK